MDDQDGSRPKQPQQGTKPKESIDAPGLMPTEPPSASLSKTNQSPAEASVLSPVSSKKPRKRLLIAAVIAAILVILLGGAALAYKFWYQNPNKVVGDALLHTLDATSVKYSGTLDVVMKDGQKTHITFDGSSAEGANQLNAKGAFVVNENEYALGGGAVLQADGTLYFKISGAKALLESMRGGTLDTSSEPLDQLVSKIDDRWIKADTSDTKKISEPVAKMQKCFADLGKRLKDDSAMRTEIADIYGKHQFVTIGKELGSKDGSLGYEVEFDAAKQYEFYQAAKNTAMYKFLHECDPSIKIEEPAKTQPSQKNTPKVELWVSRWQHEVTKISISDKTTDGSEVMMTLEPVFNEKTDITAPKASMTLEQLMTEITTTMQSLIGTQRPVTSPKPLSDGRPL